MKQRYLVNTLLSPPAYELVLSLYTNLPLLNAGAIINRLKGINNVVPSDVALKYLLEILWRFRIHNMRTGNTYLEHAHESSTSMYQ
jgi:hypothetical protein